MKRSLFLPVLIGLLLTACSGKREDPILRLSATEALEQGLALFNEGKYRQARKYLIHAFEVEPNSAAGRDGLLLAADALFEQGGFDSYVEAETRYRDFINRFPTSPRADYAQYRIAKSLAERMGKPSRDQETARKALAAFEDLQRSFPTSPHLDEAAAVMREVRDNLAAHEYVVAHFYFRYGRPNSAISRLEYLRENYPNYSETDKALVLLCRSQHRVKMEEKAAETCGQVVREFPDSKYLDKVPQQFRREGRSE